MGFYLINFYASLLAFSSLHALPNPIRLFVGKEQTSKQGIPVKIYPEITLSYTVIHARDYICNNQHNCKIDTGYSSFNYRGISFNFRTASAQMNIFPSTISESFQFMYVDDQNSLIKSMVGLSPRSDFMIYLAAQNKTAVGFKIDSKNQMSFIDDLTFQNNYLYFDLSNFVEVEIAGTAKIEKTYQRLCLTNSLDLYSDQEGYFSVEDSALDEWKRYLKAQSDAKIRNFSSSKALRRSQVASKIGVDVDLDIQDEHDHDIGGISFVADQLFNRANNKFMLTGFSVEYDDYNRCNIYTGRLLLVEWNFEFIFDSKDVEYIPL